MMRSALIHSATVLAVTSVLLLTACTPEVLPNGAPTIPSATPELPSTAPTAPGWEPDLVIERQFPNAEGDLVACTIWMRMAAVGATAAENPEQRLAAAREFLDSSDWGSVEVSLDEMPADEQARRRTQGVSDPALYAMLLQDRIRGDLEEAGYLNEGSSTEGRTSCPE